MTSRTIFQWQGDTYRLNQGTLAHWPRAKIISTAQENSTLQVVTNDEQLLAYSKRIGCLAHTAPAMDDPVAASIHALERHGHTVWSIPQAVARIDASPDSAVATALMGCLVQWFFVDKFPSALQWMLQHPDTSEP